ncbi:MAG: PfkB family carbohydrate kinase [Candidatus Kerfeldbacteria bacterium]|nr:PfkB family carbohydrate kinase [Candidatus Kerfeldbacteria bacterium]
MSKNQKKRVIVPGMMNVDIIGMSVERLLAPGELVIGGELRIGPGGKSRNIAAMIATYSQDADVFMISKTTEDPFGLWKIPITALEQSGVNTECISILPFTGQYPGIALIPVDVKGNNQIYVLPGINNTFDFSDIATAEHLFQSTLGSIVVITLETPLSAIHAAVELAKKYNHLICVDFGGIQEKIDYSAFLTSGIFFAKPNAHEARILTGVTVVDMESFREAAKKFFDWGVEHLLITVGKDGAYYAHQSEVYHVLAPKIAGKHEIFDETGCGDQTMATFVAAFLANNNIHQAIQEAICAGTLQFYSAGIQPLSRRQVMNAMNALKSAQ